MADNTIGEAGKNELCYWVSLSTVFTSQLIDKRNELVKTNAGGTATGIKIGAEFCFLGMALVSLIEAVVRAILIIVAVPYAYLTESKLAVAYTANGALLSAANATLCFVALWQNFYQEEPLNHDGILPCVNPCLMSVLEALGLLNK